MPEVKGRPERKGRMEGKVAIVTGAGSSGPGIGNGKAAAVLFAREGAKVLLADQVLARRRRCCLPGREQKYCWRTRCWSEPRRPWS